MKFVQYNFHHPQSMISQDALRKYLLIARNSSIFAWNTQINQKQPRNNLFLFRKTFEKQVVKSINLYINDKKYQSSFIIAFQGLMQDSDGPHRELNRKSLDQLFKAENIHKESNLVEKTISQGKNFYSKIVKYGSYFIPNFFNSDIGGKTQEKDRGQKTERNPQERQEGKQEQIDARRNKLNQMFAQQTQFKRDFADLKRALLENTDISQIIKFYEQQLEKKELSALRSLLQSREFLYWKNVASRKQKEEKLNQLVDHPNLEQNYVDQKEKILQREDIRFKKLLMREEIDYQKDRVRKINQLFSKNIKSDISELITAIIAKASLTAVLLQLEDKATAKEFRIIQEILNSQELKALLTPGIREKKLKLDELFGQFKSDVQRLKQALLKREDVESLLNQYEEAMTTREFTQLKNILKSQDLAEILRNKNGEKTTKAETPSKQVNKQAKIRQFFQRTNLKSDKDILVRKLLGGQAIQMILQEYSDTMPASQFKILELALTSRQLQELLKDKQVDERQTKMDELVKKYKITHDISELKSALLKGEETQSLIAK